MKAEKAAEAEAEAARKAAQKVLDPICVRDRDGQLFVLLLYCSIVLLL